MTATAEKQKRPFQAEVKELLHLMIHSLYSNKEIFLRELISNASDANDKLRFLSLAEPELLKDDTELKIQVDYDATTRTVTVTDNGIGMNEDDVIKHLGTIAKSGTREFLKTLTGDNAKDAKLIGQFGVGFYSSFIVADEVTVLTRRADAPANEGVRWQSNGEGDYSIELAEKATRGTTVILHLKEDAVEFAESWRLRNIINKYSDHIGFPIYMKKMPVPSEDGKESVESTEYEQVNRATALWTLPAKEVKDEEYQELYKHISHDFEDPLLWAHNHVEGKQQYISLLYIPAHAPYDIWNRDRPRGLKLYVQRVFIMDDAEVFMPLYLRFVKGVLDSSDLPLNVSREILQHSKVVDSLRAACVNRVLSMLEKMAQDEQEKYTKFWGAFGNVLKEGVAEDFANKERIAKLLRFASTSHDTTEQNVSLDDYIARMKSDQEKIYYITAESFNAAKNSPHLEIFRKKGIEVFLLCDRIDEWLMSYLNEYSGKQLQSVVKGALDLGKLEDETEKEIQKKAEDDYAELLKQVKEILGERIKEVRLTHRLTDSPACLVVEQNDMSAHLQRMLKDAGQALPSTAPIFELNPEHPMVMKLRDQSDDDRLQDWTEILFDQAMLAEGGHLSDPASFVKRLNKLLLEV